MASALGLLPVSNSTPGLSPDVVTFSSAISACDRAGAHAVAAALYADARHARALLDDPTGAEAHGMPRARPASITSPCADELVLDAAAAAAGRHARARARARAGDHPAADEGLAAAVDDGASGGGGGDGGGDDDDGARAPARARAAARARR